MIRNEFSRKYLIIAIAVLPFLLLSTQVFGQSASLSGTVRDASEAVLPGATIMAKNDTTGVETMVTTNNAGIYNFASLPIGSYTVTAEMPGFQTVTRTDVTLGASSRLSLNFELEVSGVETEIVVSESAADLLLESTPSTGTVMDEKVVKELPLLGNDMMQLINVMGGVVKPENTIFGNSEQTFAGVMANNINLMRDGISVNDARYGSGIVSPARLNPEMVGEFKLILTPVDAEMGRGAGQVQVMTKSGGNEYHGSGVWSVINTALDANEWNDNRTGNTPMWKNVNQYTLSFGGPIIKNKTFFFATWDHNIVRKREVVASNMLTPCARKGIYRYWPGWAPDDYDATTSTSGVPIRPSVDPNGIPLQPTENPDGSEYTDELAWGSVLGQLTPQARAQIAADPINCSQYNFGLNNTGVVPGSNWDPYRTEYDATGYTDRFSTMMPMPNYYGDGDGLNVAALRWTRTTKGEDTVYGSGMDSARKSITVKIDHNINTEHRLSGTYSYEKSFSDGEHEPTWPNGYGGFIDRKPQNLSTNLTSTLRPTLLNEFRFGLAYNFNRTGTPIDNPSTGEALQSALQDLLPTSGFADWAGLPLFVTPGVGDFRFAANESNVLGGRLASPATWGSKDYRWTFSDTMTWTRGAHSFKFGFDYRLTQANSFMNGAGGFGDDPMWYPTAWGGSSDNSQPVGLSTPEAIAQFPRLVGQDSGNGSSGTYAGIYDLMDYMTGTINAVRQYYFVNDPFANNWSDPATLEGQQRKLAMNQNEYSFFFKDDWKATSDLTLNLGLRYEYYGVPWMLNGMTVGVRGGPFNIFGGQSGGFNEWLRGVPDFNESNLTEQYFIGPDSPNPDQSLFNKDLNNFGPAVGFAWQIPWFGKGKTTLRGGYQMSYVQISRIDPNGGFMNVAGSQPGLLYPHVYGGDSIERPYLNLAMLSDLVPTSKFWDGSVEPLAIRPLTDGTQSAAVYDPNIRTPYIQSLTLALTRQIGSSLTVDVRYIGTLSRKQVRSINLNQNNWLHNGLKEAFDIARAGGESELLDTLMPPFSFWFAGSGAEQLRTQFLTAGPLATGDYNEIAAVLGTSNGLLPVPPGVEGALVRNSGLGENFIFTNRQFDGANIWGNHNNTNYHSMQAQVTLRPTHGLSFQASYTWSRNLGSNANTDPLNRRLDYGILGNHRSHQLTTYGTYNLPFGPNGYVLQDSSGWVRKLVEGWQLSWVSSLTSGLPASVSTVASMWGGSGVDLVAPELFDTKGGTVTWENGARNGFFYGEEYVQVDDPQCDNVTASLQGRCQQSLNALALASDPETIIFQHATPGVRGNFTLNQLTGMGRWNMDLAMSKNIEFMEGKSINIRFDAHNIFNHPTPSNGAPFSYDQRTYQVTNPQFGLNSSEPFGYIGYKTGHRVFSAKIRISF